MILFSLYITGPAFLQSDPQAQQACIFMSKQVALTFLGAQSILLVTTHTLTHIGPKPWQISPPFSSLPKFCFVGSEWEKNSIWSRKMSQGATAESGLSFNK